MATLRTSIEMLKDREYTNLQACQTYEEVVQNMTDAKQIVTGGGKGTIHVYFHNEERVGVKTLRTWTENNLADKIIVVSLEGPTAFTRREATEVHKHVQFFTFRDLCVNITRHVLTPKHERIDESELPYIKSDDNSELPVLAVTDKIAQYYAFELGDIVRITRTAGTQEPVYFYRIVRQLPTA